MKKIKGLLYKYGAVLFFFAFWEAAARGGLVNPVFIPPFSRVVLEIVKMIENGEFFINLSVSLLRAATGFCLALGLGVPIGFVLGGWFPKIGEAFQGLLEVCSQINPFLLLHIILLFMDVGESSKIAIITWTCAWPVIFSTISGIRNTEPDLLKLGKSFGLKRWLMFWKVVLPSTVPFLFTGIRLSAGYSFIMLIAAEMMGADSGLGYYILNSQMNFRITQMYTAVLLIAGMALLIDTFLEKLERGRSGYLYDD
ncbi:MAG: putative transporter, permease component [Anaerocolumna sp.]|jgi:NitT/TauT family transport system permease protein|nr:putative transporter, permease component [Anaerocolumna sp.]